MVASDRNAGAIDVEKDGLDPCPYQKRELIKDARLCLAVVLSTSSPVFSGLRDLVDLVPLVVRNVNNQI